MVYFVLGVCLAHQVGITWDEDAENTTVVTNVRALEGLYQGDLTPFNKLETYLDRYNGIGFQILAYPFARLLLPVLIEHTNLSQAAANLLVLHSCIFICFFFSGIFVKKIIQALLNDSLVASLSMVAFLLWPYVLGHGLMNPKDMPFMLAWLICTYYLILIAKNSFPATSSVIPAFSANSALSRYWICLGVALGWMVALRINGLLLFGVYFFCFWLACRYMGGRLLAYKKGRSLFIWAAVLSIIMFTPLFWGASLNVYRGVQFFLTGHWDGPPTTPGDFVVPSINLTYSVAQFSFSPLYWGFPIDFFRALKHFQSVLYKGTTFTSGQLLSALDLPVTYIPLWLGVKLPLISLVGLLALPLSLWRLKKRLNNFQDAAGFIGILLGVLMILLALVVRHARLHDELRHILFIFPMLWIIGVCSLYYLSRSILIGALIISSVLFVVDIVKIHPYEYVWLNEPARALKLENQYENDYWATSVGPGYQWFSKNLQIPVNECIYMYPPHLGHYLDKKKFQCVKGFDNTGVKVVLPPEDGRVYWIFKGARFRDLVIPAGCSLMHEEKIRQAFSSEEVTLAQIYRCQ